MHTYWVRGPLPAQSCYCHMLGRPACSSGSCRSWDLLLARCLHQAWEQTEGSGMNTRQKQGACTLGRSNWHVHLAVCIGPGSRQKQVA
eukprot:774217-Pelagomonas_calceolata.AAC.8